MDMSILNTWQSRSNHNSPSNLVKIPLTTRSDSPTSAIQKAQIRYSHLFKKKKEIQPQNQR